MRIIGGAARGRRLASPPAARRGPAPIRPTSDRARESLFNLLAPRIVPGIRVLDLFAGSGALGLEAVSRGAGLAVFVDKAPTAVALIRKNIALCGAGGASMVLRRDLGRDLSFLRDVAGAPFDIVFVDPPYRKGLCRRVLAGLAPLEVVAANGVIVCEEAGGEPMPEEVAPCRLTDRRRYGDTVFWLYAMEALHG